MSSGGEIEKWTPVTHDFGLIQAPLPLVRDGLSTWHAGLGMAYEVRPFHSLAAAFESLPPLSAELRRKLLIPTRLDDWTAFFQSGFNGSDPFPPMSFLSEKLDVIAMRVCRTPPDALWPAVLWEVYAPPQLGGSGPLNYRRSIAAMNDGGRWVFETFGEPFPFEDLSNYQRPKKRDRFSGELLERYLREFELSPFADEFYVPSPELPAVCLECTSSLDRVPPEFTLAEARARLRGQNP